MGNDESQNQLTSSKKLPTPDIVAVQKIVGLYSISGTMITYLNNLDSEVLLDSQRLYLIIESTFLGKKQLFAIPFRTNIPKNHNPYKALRKMSGTGTTGKGKTHGLHIAKTIPVTKKELVNSRHSKAYKPLMKDGTFSNAIGDIMNWINQFEGNEIADDFTPFEYSVKLKKLVLAVNKWGRMSFPQTVDTLSHSFV